VVACTVPAGAATRAPTPAPSAPEYGVRAALSGSTTLSHNHFAYALPPGGASVQDAVVISNYTSAPLSFDVHGADMVTATGGGFAPAAEGAPSTQVGAWVTVAQPSLTIPAHGEAADAFTLRVPPGQKPGPLLGALVVARTASDTSGVHVLTRAALIVELTVLDEVRLQAAAGFLPATREQDGVHFSVDVANHGNVLFMFTGDVAVRDGSGHVMATLPLGPAGLYVIPGGHATVSAVWSGVPLWGSASATATVHTQVTGGPSATVQSDTLQLSFFPWPVVAGGAASVAAALVALAVFWRRRRRAA